MDFCGKYIRFIALIVAVVAVRGQRCNRNVITNGYTVPQGDIVLNYGSALNITCNLYKNIIDNDKYGSNASSRLYFQRNNSPISSELVTIINSTSSTLYIENHPKTKEDNYYCYFNGTNNTQEMICMNVVKVGVAPLNVTDFSCIGRNCDNLTCTWTPPENYVKTDYKLTYTFNYRPVSLSRKNKSKGICPPLPENNDCICDSYRSSFECGSITTLSNGKKSCFWSVKTTPQYRPVHDCYYFELAMNNTFGSIVNHIAINHFKYVIPNPPENLTGEATSPHSISLSWTIPMSMVTFGPGLHHRILYQCEYYEKVWHFGALINNSTDKKTVHYNLTNLTYAHALCDIRVSMRSALADDSDDSMWSQNATRTIRTQSKKPDTAPKTNIGSFEIVDNQSKRTVFVYWRQLLEKQYNGENLIYIVKIRNTSFSLNATRSYVQFENLTLSEYVVDIWSANVIGESLNKSTLVIPAKPLDKPSTFIKEHSGSTYELSWQIPLEMEPVITNYTVFWCHHDTERPYNCSGRLNWEVLPKHVTKYSKSIPATGVYHFAISVNSLNNTSGMFWAECTVIPDKSRARIENVWIINADSDYIKVGWSLDCSNRISTIQGYIIYYCKTKTMNQTVCEPSELKSVTIKGDLNLQSAVVPGLTPCSSYILYMKYFLNNSIISQPSKTLHNATSAAAPAPPHNVQVYNVTNSSITLTWQPPPNMSCYLQQYNIYNYDEHISNTSEPKIILRNLSSYTKYQIAVTACTTKCSKRSEVKNIETLKWLPGEIKLPAVSSNDTHITIMWDKPFPPRGEISYFQLRVTDAPDVKNAQILNVTAQNYTMEGCASGKQKRFHISVRAVNIIDTVPMPGPWSSEVSHSCTSFSSVVPIVVCSAVIFLLVAMACGSKKLVAWLMDMKRSPPVLPPGLQIDKQTDKMKDIDASPQADAQCLLHKNDEIRANEESSGCSSGHESITSSLESTAHISPSDSGTEQPKSPSLSEEMRKNSLRQRVVAASRPTTNTGYVTTDTIPMANLALKPVTAIPGNYCVIGVDPSGTVKGDTSYIPLIDMNTKLPISCDLHEGPPPPYVVTGDLVKTSNPGYVPYPTTEPADKNVAYVVAGLSKDLLGPNPIQCDTPKSALGGESPHYIRASEAVPALKPMFHWPAPQGAVPKPGYVSVGDAPPPKPLTEITKGYVPHRQYEGKSLKED